MKNMREVTPTKAYAMIQKGALLVDVREPGEVDRKSFDVPEILLIPLRQLEQRYQEIPADREVIIACHSGSRSLMASRFLMNQGYKKAINMQSGIARWSAEGLPLKEKQKQNTSQWLSQLFNRKS
ncbi:MAG: rhodanese-like domain-containing protein [Chlorobium sp.]|nr:rhodanese-like domain-containing protein [Chlorobium sp.]